MDLLERFALLVLAVPIAIVFLGTALIWFAWVFTRSDNKW
jgi:hypothetical protein